MNIILSKNIKLTTLFQSFAIFLLSLFPVTSTAQNNIIFPKAQSANDASHNYYIRLINIALQKVNKSDKYTVTLSDTILSQGRTLKELSKKDGLVNIYQTGTTQQREADLISIKIPLLKGTLGYRINLIHKDNIKLFDNITTMNELSKLRACQGRHWPDSDILENSGLKVTRNSNYQNMFLQIKNKHCDYFPRAITEAYVEAEALNDPDIVVYDKLVISYLFPMYFFVSPHHKQMADDIETGLEIAIKDGSFDALFNNSQITQSLFPLSKWKKSRILKIKNHLLPISTPTSNKTLWIELPTKENISVAK